MKWIFLLLMALVPSLAASLDLPVASPVGLSHHGRLLDASDTPVNGQLDVHFALYTSASGGSPVWEEEWEITFTNGHYAVLLGDPASDGQPIAPALLDQPLWLGITVASGAELAPRQRLAAAAYALRAVRADSVVGGHIAGATITGSSVQATSLTIGDRPLFDSDGVWVAAPGTVPFPTADEVVLRTDDQIMDGSLTAHRFLSTATDGPPLVVASTELVPNLNAAMLGGLGADAFVDRASFAESAPFNLARNTSFEQGTDGALPRGWSASGTGTIVATTGGLFGNRLLRVEDAGGAVVAHADVLSSSDAAGFAGRRITASVWARRVGGDDTGRLCVVHGAGAGERTCAPLTSGFGWSRTTVTHTVGESPLSISIQLHATTEPGAAATWEFDGLMVTEGSLAPAWSPNVVELLAAGGVGGDQLADGSVTTAKLADGAVTAPKLATGAVGTLHFQAGAVDSAALADGAVHTDALGFEAVTGDKLSPGAVDSAHLAANAVTTSTIGDQQVTTEKLADGAVTTDKLGTASVDSNALAQGAVLTDRIANGAVTAEKLAEGAVGVASLEDGSVTRQKIALEAVDSDRLAPGAVTAGKLGSLAVGNDALANGAVTGSKISDGAVTETKLGPGAVTTSKLATGAVLEDQLGTGAVSSTKLKDSAVGTAALADAAVTSAKIGPNAVTAAKLATNAVTSSALADGAVTEAKLRDGAVTTTKLGLEAVTHAQLADGAVTETKLGPGSVNQVALADGAVVEAKIRAGAVSATKLADGSVITDKLQNQAVTEAKLANGAVTENKLGVGAVATTKLRDGAVTTLKLGASAVHTGNINNLAVTSDKLANGAVTTLKLGDGQVTTNKLGDGQVTGVKLADGSVSSGKLVAGAVGNAQLANDAVTAAKVQAGSLTGDRLANNTVPATKLIQGPGSGLNADLLDGVDSATFVRKDQSNTIVGDLTVNGTVAAGRLSGPYYPAHATWSDPAYSVGNNGAGIVNDPAPAYQALMIVGADHGTGRGRWVRIWDYLTVEGSAHISGSLSVNQGVWAQRELSGRVLRLETANWNDYGTGPGGAALYNAPSHSALMIHGADHGVGRGHWVRMWEYVSVHGTLEVDGDLLYGNDKTRTQTRDNPAIQGGNSGFYETSNPVNYYPGSASWQHLIEARHSNRGNNYALQIAGSFFDQDLWFRKTDNDGGKAWQQVIGSGHRNCAFPFNSVGVAISNAVDGVWKTNTICGTIRFGHNTYQEAQLHCWSLGGHVATYSETYLLGLHYGLSNILVAGDWLGSRNSDDSALCANNANDQWNFDGNCNKNDNYRAWRCIQTTPHVP